MISGDTFPAEWEYTRAVLLHKGGENNKKRFRIIVVDWFGRKRLENIICNRVEVTIEKIHQVPCWIQKEPFLWSPGACAETYLREVDRVGPAVALERAGIYRFTARLVMKLAAR
eukprot:9289771-Heterocapsa_arctica.AAC.1